MNNKRIKMVVFAGLTAALYAVFFLMSKYFGGLLESVLFCTLPIPMCIFTYKYSIKYSIIPFISIIIICLFIDPLKTIVYIFSANILGMTYGQLVRKNVKSSLRLLFSILVCFVVNLFSMFILAKFLNYSLKDEIYSFFELVFKIFNLNKDNIEGFENVVYACMPIYILIAALADGYASHLLMCLILNKLKIKNISYGKIIIYSFPKYAAFVYIICLILMFLSFKYLLIGKGLIHILSFIIFDITWTLAFIFSIQGYLNLSIYFSKRRLFLLPFIVFVIGFILCFPMILLLYSLIDIIFIFSDYNKYLLYNNK